MSTNRLKLLFAAEIDAALPAALRVFWQPQPGARLASVVDLANARAAREHARG